MGRTLAQLQHLRVPLADFLRSPHNDHRGWLQVVTDSPGGHADGWGFKRAIHREGLQGTRTPLAWNRAGSYYLGPGHI